MRRRAQTRCADAAAPRRYGLRHAFRQHGVRTSMKTTPPEMPRKRAASRFMRFCPPCQRRRPVASAAAVATSVPHDAAHHHRRSSERPYAVAMPAPGRRQDSARYATLQIGAGQRGCAMPRMRRADMRVATMSRAIAYGAQKRMSYYPSETRRRSESPGLRQFSTFTSESVTREYRCSHRRLFRPGWLRRRCRHQVFSPPPRSSPRRLYADHAISTRFITSAIQPAVSQHR